MYSAMVDMHKSENNFQKLVLGFPLLTSVSLVWAAALCGMVLQAH